MDLSNQIDHPLKMLTLVEAHDCSYLPKQKANSIFLDHETPPSWAQYCQLTQLGFRRSGNHFYRPQCPSCDACKSSRIRASEINLNKKRFKRLLNKSSTLSINLVPAKFSEEHYSLYENYIKIRHKDGDMYPPTENQYKGFLLSNNTYSQFLEIRDSDDLLIACTAVDILHDGLSAIYTYFNVDYESLSPGTLAVLLLCVIAKQRSLDYVYLGYWVKDCQKMNYKAQFKPIEIFNGDIWQSLVDEP